MSRKAIGRCLGLLGIVAAGGAIAAGVSLPERLGGVYKTQFNNALVSGETYRSEDILEIVPTAPGAAYVRAHLEFYNGHLCGLSGIAHVEGSDLVYREPAARPAGDRSCVLHVGRKGDKVVLSDEEGSCKSYCGMRGSFSNDSFPASARRPIRYLPRLKASREYKDAIKQDGAKAASGSAG